VRSTDFFKKDFMTTADIQESSPVGSLLSRTIRSSAWTVSGFGVSQIIRLTANLVLTRLLVPEMFGLMTLVSTFIAGLHMFPISGSGRRSFRAPMARSRVS